MNEEFNFIKLNVPREIHGHLMVSRMGSWISKNFTYPVKNQQIIK